jgi:hypothetical protein
MLTRAQQYEIHKGYIEENGLDRLVNFHDNADYVEGVFDSVMPDLATPYPPDAGDLVRLHKLVRERKCFTILEFGVGYSTVIMADALRQNERDWNNLASRPEIRNRHMFRIFSVDTSKKWIDVAQGRIPDGLSEYITLHHSDAEIGTFEGRLCHFYTHLPDVIADFIYLDGPLPAEVKGSIRGMTFQCPERTVMSGDLLLMEPTFLPGTFILVDGRTNNARFLERHFSRQYRVHWDKDGDITTFELDEERLGKYNLLGSDFL